MYHDVKHKDDCLGLSRINPEPRDCTCGKVVERLQSELAAAQSLIDATTRSRRRCGASSLARNETSAKSIASSPSTTTKASGFGSVKKLVPCSANTSSRWAASCMTRTANV